LRETIELTKQAHELKYDAAMVVTPYYYVKLLNDDVLINYYKTIADSSRIPIILYNIPQYSGLKSLSEEVVLELSKHENIIGIKESGSVDVAIRFAQITKHSKNFQVFNGNASVLLHSLKNGCAGGILGSANIVPSLCYSIWKNFKENKLQEAEVTQEKLKKN